MREVQKSLWAILVSSLVLAFGMALTACESTDSKDAADDEVVATDTKVAANTPAASDEAAKDDEEEVADDQSADADDEDEEDAESEDADEDTDEEADEPAEESASATDECTLKVVVTSGSAVGQPCATTGDFVRSLNLPKAKLDRALSEIEKAQSSITTH